MANSKDYIVPIWPKDLSSIIREGLADHTPRSANAFTPGTLVYRDSSGELAKVDEDNVFDQVELVWTDGTSRYDVDHVTSSGGTKTRYTTLQGPMIVKVKLTLFEGSNGDAAPAAGMVVCKAEDANAGLLRARNAAGLATAFNDAEETAQGVIIGRIIEVDDTWATVKFN